MENITETPRVGFKWTAPELRVLRPKEKIKPSEWAAKYRYVVTGNNQGKWENELTPYAIEPMDTFALPWVRRILLSWPPQSGKTATAFNCLLYSIDVDPGPAMYIMPDEKVAKRISRRQLIPTMRSTPKIAELLGPRSDDVTTLHVNFTNGMDIMMAWATSAAVMASESVRYIFYDEPGKYPEFVGQEADPFSLANVRLNAYQHTSKEIFFSTMAKDGDHFDRIFRNEMDEIRRYHARCPYCHKLQIMRFENIHWHGQKDHRVVLRKKLARYTCEKCGMDWDDYTRNQAVLAGSYMSEKPVERPGSIAFELPGSWYSPFVSMSKAAWAFLLGQTDVKKLQGFRNVHENRPWKEVIEPKQDKEVLSHKTNIPPGIVPSWAVALTAGIDVQKIGFWFVVRAWAADLTSHLVQYGYLSTFEDVRTLVFDTYFKRENSEEKFQIWRAAMDTGGGLSAESDWTRTEEIYAFLSDYGQGVIHAVKGSSRPMFSLVKSPPTTLEKMPHSNKPISGGLELRLIDSFELKKLILNFRLNRKDERKDAEGNVISADDQRFYLHSETGLDYSQQLLAEELQRDRRGKLQWKKKRTMNHLLDCEVMAAACVDRSWTPSFKMLADFLAAEVNAKELKKKQKPKAIRDERFEDRSRW